MMGLYEFALIGFGGILGVLAMALVAINKSDRGS